MDRISGNGVDERLAEYETPFADTAFREAEKPEETSYSYPEQISPELENPFAATFDAGLSGENAPSPIAGEVVNFLSELHSDEFGQHLYEMALELEDAWSSKISNEAAMGERFTSFATQEATQYFEPVLNETTRMIDRVSRQFGGNNFADVTEAEVERFFETLETDHAQLSPAQEQFFGGLLNKVKSVVKKGIDLARKGVAAVGKFLPSQIILNKLKGLIRPLLDKVLSFAIGKLPKNLQPYAQTLAKKLLNLEADTEMQPESDEIPATGSLEAIQTEFDSHIANLVFSPGEAEADQAVMEYESSSDGLQRQNLLYESSGLNLAPLDVARQQFIDELKQLPPGQSPAPAIERFLPVAIMALQPVIKIAMSIIGRQKIINFLAGLLAKLVAKYVPEEVAKPLATSIVDVGLSAIGFETNDRNRSDLAYEAIANTIQETVQNMGVVSEETLNDPEALMAETLEAFQKAAVNNFPSQLLKENKRLTADNGTWVMMPRSGRKHSYKKYTRTFEATIDNRIASTLTTFRGTPLANFLKDKLGLDLSKSITARVHLYEAIEGTKLYKIARSEKIPGLDSSGRHGYRQLHPLTVEAASLLLKEPKLGRDLPAEFTTRRHHTAVGQRFYYLEIPGASLKLVAVAGPAQKSENEAGTVPGQTPVPKYVTVVPNSSDIQGTINIVRSEIILNYYLSEEDAKDVAEKLNARDAAGAFMNIRHSIRDVLHGMLHRNIGNKVKIIHEAMPEMYLDNFEEKQEHFSWSSLGSRLGGFALNAGKGILRNLVDKLINKISERAFQAVVNHFKTRVNEFITAQSAPQDGVTIEIIWSNIPGMAAIGTIINAVKGKLSLGKISDLSLPGLPVPEVKISAGKNFE
jgi:hypothetical protein